MRPLKSGKKKMCASRIGITLGWLAVAGVLWTKTAHSNADQGAWSDVMPWPHVAVSATALPMAKCSHGRQTRSTPFPTTGACSRMPPCLTPTPATLTPKPRRTRHVLRGDLSESGDLFAAGGNSSLTTSSLFTADTHDWALSDPMPQRRWYGITPMTTGKRRGHEHFARSADLVPDV